MLGSMEIMGQLNPPKLPPTNKQPALKKPGRKYPTLTQQQILCAEWMTKYKKFWLHILHKDENEILDMTANYALS
jgi:hypothetical protein